MNNWNIEKAQDMKYSIWRAKFKILRNYGEWRDRCRGGNTIFSLQIWILEEISLQEFSGNKSIKGLVYFLALIPSYNAVLNFGASLQLQWWTYSSPNCVVPKECCVFCIFLYRVSYSYGEKYRQMYHMYCIIHVLCVLR